jgi:hypothetical protein
LPTKKGPFQQIRSLFLHENQSGGGGDDVDGDATVSKAIGRNNSSVALNPMMHLGKNIDRLTYIIDGN